MHLDTHAPAGANLRPRFAPNERGRDLVVGDIHGHFATLRRALDELEVGKHDRLPEKLTAHGAGEVWIADGDYPVFFAPGGPDDEIPTTMHLGDDNAVARYAVIQFGDDDNPLPSELCSDIALAPYIGLVGLAIIGAVAGGDEADAMIGTPSATPSAAATGGHWSVRAPASGATAVNLDALASGQVNLACSGDDKHIALILR